MKIAFIGLGKMGTRMVEKLLRSGHEVVAWNRTYEVAESFSQQIKNQTVNSKNTDQKLKIAETIDELAALLDGPRIIWIMLPAGDATEYAVQELLKVAVKGDIVIDGGNSYYKDTERRSQLFLEKGIRFLGIGVSGGVIAAQNGYPLMVGGDVSAYQYITTVLDDLSKPHGGHEYFGTGGSGHYVKMVHNAIEYSYMQGIGEGFGVLEKSIYNFDLEKVARLYTKNTLISGFMMDRTVEVLENDPKLSSIEGIIGKASGETIWTVEEAKKMGVQVENIEQALEFRNRSETDKTIQQSFAAKMVSALRNAFGGHEVKKKKN